MRLPRHLLPIAAIVLLGAGVLAWQRVSGAPVAQARPQVLILIDRAARAELGPLLDQYRQDAARSLTPTYGAGVHVEVREIDLTSYGTLDEAAQNRLTVDVARELRRAYQEDGLVGIVLVGAVPLPRAYDAGSARLTLYPWIDMDDAAFTESPAAGRFERAPSRDPRPELWSGVIRRPENPLPEATLLAVDPRPAPTLRDFFDDNHRAHAGETATEHRVLVNDLWGEEQLRDVRLPGGRVPTAQELPGGSELALRDTAARLEQRIASSGRYDGVNYADAGLPKGKADGRKTVKELLDKARKDGKYDAIERWKRPGALKQVDVASQVVLYFDRWAEIEVGRLDRVRDAARTVVPRAGFDLFSRTGYDFCTGSAPVGGDGYFGLPEADRAAIARAGGMDRGEMEFLLRWTKLYSDGEKRLAIVRGGVPPYGRYRGVANTYDVRMTVAPGGAGYELRGARMDGVCLQTGATAGGALEVLLGAATARESSLEPQGSIALWATTHASTQAALGNVAGPPADIAVPQDIATLDRAAVAALAARADSPGFGRSGSVRGTAEGVGFEADPFLLAVFAGQPFGEAVRATFDEQSVLYGDPTFRLR